ncbi:glycosyltransferase involved in cell wall biosynthesis [Pontibacter aydingkolensis]|uniref:Glycosyltransferase family 4 protein n=1 Tax=Pontibacter aydingkolensis TaxID=1911536 RepID=A0ABS7CV67_9BACT|nr:glycosyltransferase family 4 protein [Pontibacter aydingkolensis]MBW7467668.1 glycosyltransferase family 4 protein [Pontibacter aydingkolensis]
MKIIFLAGSLNQGGAEYQIIALAKLFKDKGHDVEVFALTDYDFYLPLINEYAIKYSCLRNDQSRIKRILLTVKKIRASKPDLIISYLKVVSQVAIVAKLISFSKSKLIISERTSLLKPLQDQFHFNLALLADHVTVNSVSKFHYIKQKFPLLAKKLSFVPNIIDVMYYSPSAVANTEPLLNRLTFVGRISPEKNVVELVQAVANLLSEGYDLTLDLYGSIINKSYTNQVASLIESKSIGDKIKLKGKISNVKEVYDTSDLICLVSKYEGFSNVLAEALSSGIPVVASDIEENRYLIEDSTNGFLVNPNDVTSISTGIKNFLTLNRNERQILKLNNRKKAEALLDKEKIYQQYIDIIKFRK